MNIGNVCDFDTMLRYFGEKLEWNIDMDELIPVSHTYHIYSADTGIKEKEFAGISYLYRLSPMTDNMPFGVFAVSFESRKLETASLRKILYGLVRKKRDEHLPEWNMHELIFLCLWGERDNKYIGAACFDDNDKKLTELKIEYIQTSSEETSHIDKFEEKLAHMKMPADTKDIRAWKNKWKNTFSAVYHKPVTDSKILAEKLGELARNMHDNIIDIYNVETDKGYVNKLYGKFRKKLFHELTIEQFADMYAQTVAYGLFSAKCMGNNENFEWKDAVEKILYINPFLKSFFENESNSAAFFDELELAEIIRLLDNTDINSVLDYRNRQAEDGREDTVIYFYEDFLDKYEHETKKRRGVYYTPQPVVRFMVKAVDDILKQEFGFNDGLADTAEKTVQENVRGRKNGISANVPAIQILDPAAGTGTFLREVIINIHDTFTEKHKGKTADEIKRLWNEYVSRHLLKRINGFELMLAPYTVAHMKLAMVLKDTGYDLGSGERLNVLLTNSLEPAASQASFSDVGQRLKKDTDPFVAEAYEADRTKNNRQINVIIGNPPYSGISSNNNEYISKLIDDYKYIEGEYFNEKKHWLNDDYVKFIRYCEQVISDNEKGVLALITNNGFLDNPSFKGMRYHLLKTFDRIRIINLHGSRKKREACDDGSRDENIFDIMQGVSINIFIKNSKASKKDVCYADIFGSREYKYRTLSENKLQYKSIDPVQPFYCFNDTDNNGKVRYEYGFKCDSLFPVRSTGYLSGNDKAFVSDTREKLLEAFPLLKEEFVCTALYRPFDKKEIIFVDSKKSARECNITLPACYRNRYAVMKHILNRQNIALLIGRQGLAVGEQLWNLVFAGKNIIDLNVFYRGGENVMPLYLYSEGAEKTVRTPNLDPVIVREFSEKLGLPFAPDSDGGERESFAPIELFDYIYAVLHSIKYREAYKEFLKTDFPRVPYPTDIVMFRRMSELGGQIRKIHLMEELPDIPAVIYPVEGENEVTKPVYRNGKVYINREQYFDGVPALAWDFCIGGYQPLQKWIKDRKGRKLSDKDIIHYRNIISALIETDRLMKEIDKVFRF